MTAPIATAESRKNQPAQIKGILFDKDGTLLDYDASWAPVNRKLALMAAQGDQALANQLLRQCGMDPDTGEVFADSLLAAGNSREIAEGLCAAGSALNCDALTLALDALFAEAAAFSVAVTDLLPLFQTLKKAGLKLGIASSDNERSIRAIVARFALEPYVDFIAGYDSGHGCKPEPGMVLGFCAATGLAPQNVAMVGDNNHDLIMGRRAGTGLAIAVLTGTGTQQSLAEQCDFCLGNISELPVFLEQLRENALEQFQQKWNPDLRPELRKNKGLERCSVSEKHGNALSDDHARAGETRISGEPGAPGEHDRSGPLR